MTYHSVTWLFYGRRLRLNHKHLVMQTKLRVITNSDIAGKEPKLALFTDSSHARIIGYSDVVT